MGGDRSSSDTERRRESRWQEAREALGPGWTLERCPPGWLAPLLPLALGRAPERAIVHARGEWLGAPAHVVECETTVRAPGAEELRVESLIVVLDHPHAIGGAAIEFDPWTAYTEAQGRDPEIGEPHFDRTYRVHAASELAARASIPPPLAAALLARRFRGTLELRQGRVIALLPDSRLSPPAARSVARLGQSLARALTRGAGGPYRGTNDPRR